MHIVVCLKMSLDPEITPQHFQLDPLTNRPVYDSADLILDSYAENALELAIRLRDQTPGSRVTALCLGDELSEDALRRAISFTANEAVRVWDPEWTELDGLAIGHILAQTIRLLEPCDIVLTGYQASDIEEGLVGPVIAEELGIPCVTLASDLEADGGRIKAICEAEDGHIVLSSPAPAVFTIISSEKNIPRLPKLKDVRLARSHPIRLVGSDEIGIDAERRQPRVNLERAYVRNIDVACEILPGKDGAELANALTIKLKSSKVL